MDLTTLVFVACLVTEPTACHEIRQQLDGAPIGCVVFAPPIIARWVDYHPGFVVNKWTCTNAVKT